MTTDRSSIALLLAMLSCSPASPMPSDGGVEASVCTFTDPTCTQPVPSYSGTVHPILVATCVNCHYPGSGLAQTSLTTYADVHLVFGAALDQVSNCLMPAKGSPGLTEEQRVELLTWLACGAPDN